MKYDLEDRTEKFSQNIISLCQSLPKTIISIPLIKQLIRSATSVGANYCEANGASGKRDFKNKILICKKEILESKYWLKMLTKAQPTFKDRIDILWKEAQELTLIFSKIAHSSK